MHQMLLYSPVLWPKTSACILEGDSLAHKKQDGCINWKWFLCLKIVVFDRALRNFGKWKFVRRGSVFVHENTELWIPLCVWLSQRGSEWLYPAQECPVHLWLSPRLVPCWITPLWSGLYLWPEQRSGAGLSQSFRIVWLLFNLWKVLWHTFWWDVATTLWINP